MTLLLGQRNDKLGHLVHHMARIMDRMFKPHSPYSSILPHWHPAIDVCELPERYEIIVDLAGMKKEDIHVYSEGSTLVICGWRPDPSPACKVHLHQMEIEQGRFERKIILPTNASCEGIRARYRNGLLRIFVPKT